MKHILKIISFIFCITLFIFVCSCTESAPSTNKYTVTFKDYDGTILREEVIQEGHNATAPTDPERYGYIFVGWDNEYTNITKDTILIAQYEKDESVIIEYTVTFVDYNGTLIKEEQVEEGHNATAPSDPKREGYKFIGWDKDYSNVTSNLTVIAQYELIEQEETIEKYTVTFVTNSETIIESQEVEEGHKINEPEIPNKKGYSFVGWYIDEEEWNFDRFSVFEDTTLVAKYEIVIYTIEYDLNNGLLEQENPTTYTVEEEITLNNPTKEGYEFVGWTENIEQEPQLNVTLKDEVNDKYFIANFIPNKYKITLDVNGGTPFDNNEIEIEYDSTFDITPEREGYAFIGWYTENNEVFELGIYKQTNDLTLKAKWFSEKYDYEIKDGIIYVNFGRYPQTVVSDELIIKELELISEENEYGYIEYNGNEYKKIVAKASEELGASKEFSNGYEMINGNVYYFKVEPIRWRVLEEKNDTYKLLSDVILDISSFYTSYETRMINGQTIYPANYEYSDIRAWLNGYDGTYYNVDNYTNSGFIDIAFDKNEQKLIEKTLVDNSINSTNVEENLYLCNNTKDKIYLLSDSELTNPLYGFEEQTRTSISRQAKVTDYTICLGGYYSESFNSGCWWGRTPWLREFDRGRSVTYVSDGGSIYPSEIKIPTLEETGVRPVIEISVNNSNENVVTFRDFYGTILKEDYVENGQSALPPSDVSKEGYEFVGWSKDYTNVQFDLEVYAKYNPIKYTITFDSDGGHLVDDIEFTIETINFILPITIKDGYKFLGWYEEDKLIENIECRNYNLLAKWEKQETYTVTFDTDGGILNAIDFFAKEFVDDFSNYSNEVVDKINFTKTTSTAIKNFFNKEEVLVEYKWLLEFALSEMKNAAKENDYVDNEYYNNVVELLEKMISLDTTAINGDYANGRTIFRWWLQGLLNSNLAETNYNVYDKFMVDYSDNDNLRRFLVLLQDQENTFEVSKDDKIPDCYKDGYTFLGWYNGENKVEEITGNLTLTAKWEKIEEKVNVEIYEENGQLYVNLGRYPQTVVTEETIINALSNISTTNSLGYIEYNGNEYKKVVANPYSSNYTFINGNTIIEGNTYYFLVEPIKWRVLEENNGTYKLLCEMLIDNTNFYHTYNENRTIDGETIYPNNYEYSNVRAWLNGYDGSSYNVEDYTNKGFLDIAFTEEEKLLINTTLVDNSLASTGDTSNSYICNNTNDKVYLLSRSDTLNTNYGFSSDYYEEDVARRAQVSDYARSKYCYMNTSTSYYGNCNWWLRSPSSNNSNPAGMVFSYGNVNSLYNVYQSFYGVRPALTITIE